MSRGEITDNERDEVAEFVERHWHSQIVMSSGRAFLPAPGAWFHRAGRRQDRRASDVSHRERRDGNPDAQHDVGATRDLGSSLLLNAIETARRNECRRLWLTTTNDALRIIGFYQRLGLRMIRINLGVVDEARRTKPQIPETGERGIPIHDEIVMELELEPAILNDE